MNELVVNKRASGVELLKIFGIFLVIISHVVQTLGSNRLGFLPYNDYYIDLSVASWNIQNVILSMLRYSGTVGNSIFFICSAWYLLDKKETNVKKAFRMLCEIWIISIIWLVITILFTNIEMDKDYIFRCLFPTANQNNWYLTTYLVFIFVFPFLNLIINNISKTKHLIISVVLLFCYVISSFPLSSSLILWISIYFIIGYLKKYCRHICDNIKLNKIMLIINILIQLGTIILFNVISILTEQELNLLWYLLNGNIFILVIAFSALNIYRHKSIQSNTINYISSLSMLIYIIHENIIFRDYYRTHIWHLIYNHLGYDLVLLWAILYSIILFVLSLLVAVIYKHLLQKAIYFMVDKIYSLFKNCFNILINKLNNLLNRNVNN